MHYNREGYVLQYQSFTHCLAGLNCHECYNKIMEIFAHKGVEHGTKVEAVGHIISDDLVPILIIVAVVTTVTLSAQWLMRKTSKIHVNINERER